MDIRRNIILILSISLLAASWFVLPDGRLRNAFLMIFSSLSFIILLTPSLPSFTSPIPQNLDVISNPSTPSSPISFNPLNNLHDCLSFHRISNHPAATELLARIDDYRRLVLDVAKERAGLGSLWKSIPDDPRLSGCLCGSLTRDEVIKSLEIQEDDPPPPRVGAGMGIEHLLLGSPNRGSILAEDGNPSIRILHDLVTDRLFNILISHRPEAREHLRMAQERYHENILRRLVGPLDGKGRPIFPLCRWRKRYDGHHFSNFEKVEHLIAG